MGAGRAARQVCHLDTSACDSYVVPLSLRKRDGVIFRIGRNVKHEAKYGGWGQAINLVSQIALMCQAKSTMATPISVSGHKC